jgi:hypothetical protein
MLNWDFFVQIPIQHVFLRKTNFLSFPLYFFKGIHTTNLRGTLASVPISTHPTVHTAVMSDSELPELEPHEVSAGSQSRNNMRGFATRSS